MILHGWMIKSWLVRDAYTINYISIWTLNRFERRLVQTIQVLTNIKLLARNAQFPPVTQRQNHRHEHTQAEDANVRRHNANLNSQNWNPESSSLNSVLEHGG
jgi:hypothetical protein